jgi:hypothetical protein
VPEHPLLHQVQLDIQDLPQILAAQRPEGDDLVEAVDELRRKLAAGRLHTAAFRDLIRQLLIEFSSTAVLRDRFGGDLESQL